MSSLLNCAPWKGNPLFRMVLSLVLLLVQLPYIGCEYRSAHPRMKSNLMKCRVHDPSSLLHEFYHPGNLIVGGITCQSFFKGYSENFKKSPTTVLIKESK